MASRVVTATIFVLAAILVLRVALRPYHAARDRLHHCEEHLALVRGSALDRAGWLYGTPRMHDEDDNAYRKRIARARSRTFAV